MADMERVANLATSSLKRDFKHFDEGGILVQTFCAAYSEQIWDSRKRPTAEGATPNP